MALVKNIKFPDMQKEGVKLLDKYGSINVKKAAELLYVKMPWIM